MLRWSARAYCKLLRDGSWVCRDVVVGAWDAVQGDCQLKALTDGTSGIDFLSRFIKGGGGGREGGC